MKSSLFESTTSPAKDGAGTEKIGDEWLVIGIVLELGFVSLAAANHFDPIG